MTFINECVQVVGLVQDVYIVIPIGCGPKIEFSDEWGNPIKDEEKEEEISDET